jgi:hypothetical protein
MDSISVYSGIQPANLHYPVNVIPGVVNDHRFKGFLPQRAIMSIVLTNHTIIGSIGAICFISQLKWPIPIPNSIPIWFFRQMETNDLFEPVYLFEPVT